jgi:hypothetical protein
MNTEPINMTRDTILLHQSESHQDTDMMSEAEIDENLLGSFPASDPPSWTLGRDPQSVSESTVTKEVFEGAG